MRAVVISAATVWLLVNIWGKVLGLSPNLFVSGLRRSEAPTLVTRSASRRELVFGAATAASRIFEGRWEELPLEENCDCCEVDWCHCEVACDCAKVLKGRGYAVPLDAEAAYLTGGGVLQARVLNWNSGNFPAWNPIPGAGTDVRNSSIQGAGQGLFAAAPIDRGSVLPPYQGLILNNADLTRVEYAGSEMNFVWCPRSRDVLSQGRDNDAEAGSYLLEPTFCVDGELLVQGNPARFVNGARTEAQCSDVNMEICELGNVAYFRTTKDIAPDSELFVNYGPRYWPDFKGC
mmetsp:Transcript_25481/g.73134  ORF Transcript_25481/g.73134 Transcript_25481/m.73134 type:complete len:290 (+) Transcript_25481:129-998(+)